MGRWSCDFVHGAMTPHDTPQNFGTNLHVSIKMTYHPSPIGRFVEMPILDWHERFIMIEHHMQKRWMFESNMYEHNPGSRTLLIWRSRYFAAYDNAHGRRPIELGSSRLLDKRGQQVPGSALAAVAGGDRRAKTAAVQDYLKRNGGSLLIGIHDRPSLVTPQQGQNKERLLLFRCGVRGHGSVYLGMQYLHADHGANRQDWQRSEQASWLMPDLPLPAGYGSVDAPLHVTRRRPQILAPGEVD